MNELKTDDATVQGARTPVTLDEGAAMLHSQGGTLTAVVQVTRKATGKVESYEVVFGAEPTKEHE